MAGRFKIRYQRLRGAPIIGKNSFDIGSKQTVKGRSEIGTAGGSGKYAMTKANPRGADFVNRETKGTGPGTNTQNDVVGTPAQ